MNNKRPYDFFVTGTDTEIGKTFSSSALLQAFALGGTSSVGMKPIASGAELRDGVWHNEDVDRLIAASSVKADTALVCPYLMQTPAAPHLVAVIVEGVGGFCVPLNDTVDTADLAQQLDLPVILVVGLRLGCINHALLTAQAIRAHGLRLAAWIANTVDQDMLYLADNIAAIQQRIGAPLLGHIPRLSGNATDNMKTAATYLNLDILK